jgi:ankyrin repeat protein
MDKLTKLLSKVTGEKLAAPPPPPVQQQNLPSVTAQPPTPSSFIPARPSPAPPGGATTCPVYGTSSGSAQPSAQDQFFKAVEEGNYEEVNKALLSKPAQINISELDQKSGMSALRIALTAKNDLLAQLLVAQGNAPVNAEARGGETPLILAVRNDLLKTSKSLLRRGAAVNDQDMLRKTALHYGCENKNENVELVQALLDACADKDKTDGIGNTPLSIACRKGHVNVVKLLLERGAVVNQSGKGKDQTPLLEACKLENGKASADIIDVLCANGASLDCYSELGETPFLVAIKYKNFSALEALIAKLGDDPAKITAYLNKPNDRGETAWTIVSSPEYDRRELGYLPSHIKMLDDIKSLLIKHRATQ